MWISAGGVVLDSLDEPHMVYVIKPSNDYGPWCLPKGQIDEGETQEQAAVREVQEESGVPARILPGSYLGTGKGQHSITHYYVMVRTGPVGSHDFETEEVQLLPIDEAQELFKSVGNVRDAGVLSRAKAYLNKGKVTVTENKLNEVKLNLLGKIFFAACGAWLVGKATNMKLRGTEQEINAVANAMLASRKFQDELRKPGATVESVMNKLGLKHATAKEFERILGIPFPLAIIMLLGATHAIANFYATFAL